jgi:TPR repeat protein
MSDHRKSSNRKAKVQALQQRSSADSFSTSPLVTNTNENTNNSNDINDKNDVDDKQNLLMDVASGDGAAMFQLGCRFQNGRGVSKNVKQARTWFRRAVDADNDDARVALGQMYASGTGVKQCKQMAFQFYRRAADNGCAEAMRHVGLCFLDAFGAKRNAHAAVEWLGRAMDAGVTDIMADFDRARIAEDNEMDLIRPLSLRWFPPLVSSREYYTQSACERNFKLATWRFGGFQVETDKPTALAMFRDGANSCHVPSIFYLVKCYFSGEVFRQDDAAAVRWCERAVNLGDGHAMLLMAMFFSIGAGVEQSQAKSSEWLERARCVDSKMVDGVVKFSAGQCLSVLTLFDSLISL